MSYPHFDDLDAMFGSDDPWQRFAAHLAAKGDWPTRREAEKRRGRSKPVSGVGDGKPLADRSEAVSGRPEASEG